MPQFLRWTMLSFVGLSVAACQTPAPVSECDGWAKLKPSSETRRFIVAKDRPFAEQVASHNQFGAKRGCWK